MGSQTFEILRQGVWASLTGGWFYDPHQTVFCNVIHLYLWLFLLCGPFLTYLYFPTTFSTWGIYCLTTTFTITVLKVLNMALHVLYDKAQAISDPNIKVDLKGSKESAGVDDCGIEMQVLGNDMPSRISQPINEVSEANSMISMNENVTSTIDLKVDVHRKNSSESSDSISTYPPSIYQNIPTSTYHTDNNQIPQMRTTSSFQQQQQQCQTGRGISKTKDLPRRYSDNSQQVEKSLEIPSQYSLPIFKDYQHNPIYIKHNPLRHRQHNRNYSQGQEIFSEIWKTAAVAAVPSTSAATNQFHQPTTYQEISNTNNNDIANDSLAIYSKKDEKKRKNKFRCLERQNSLDAAVAAAASEANALEANILQTNRAQCFSDQNNILRQRSIEVGVEMGENIEEASSITGKPIKRLNKTSKLQRHRSTESHEEQQRRNNRNGLFLSGLRQDHTNLPNLESNNCSNSQLTKRGYLYNRQQQPNISHHHRHRINSTLIGSSDMYLDNSNYTKSDLGIEQLDQNLSGNGSGNGSNKIHNLLLEQSKSMRKNSTSTMSALQLPVVSTLNLDQQQQKTRRHSNTSCKPVANASSSSGTINSNGQQASVRRIKSTALEVACPQPSVSNLSPHPNSVEAIAGQQQIKSNPPLLPPPSKCLVRIQHLNLCSKFGSLTCNNSNSDVMVGNENANGGIANTSDPVYPIAEQIDEKNQLNDAFLMSSVCTDTDEEDEDDEDDEDDNDDNGEKNLECVNNEENKAIETKRSSMTTESESEIERPRTQSTDSETDNNGSRSPLLNKCNREISKPRIQESSQKQNLSMLNEKNGSNVQKINNNNYPSSNNNNKNVEDVVIARKNGGDSGCPSSDYEQISSSSKDMLLDKSDQPCSSKSENSNSNNLNSKTETNEMQIVPFKGIDIAQEEADIENLRVKDAKSLGAIPKAVMRRSSEIPIASGMGAPIGMSGTSMKRSIPRSMSRTSSSASSRSFSAESFSNDIYKTYRDRYSFILGQEAANQGLTLPSSHPINFNGPYPRRPFNDGVGNFRFKHKLHLIDPDGTVIVASNTSGMGNGSGVASAADTSKLDENFDFGSDELNKHEGATTLSIQGLMNEQYSFENSLVSGDHHHHHHHHQHSTRQSSTGAILNVEINDSIYCDYWRTCHLSTDKPIQPKRFYKYRWKFFGKREFKIAMDRLQLLALFDRDLNWFHVILAIFLSSTTCFLGAYILQLELYKDIFAFIFCIVIAGSQYSLLKSVQPDAASPIHGFNKTVAYSRPIYFCLCSALLIFTHQMNEKVNNDYKYNNYNNDRENYQHVSELFGLKFSLDCILNYLTYFMSIILLLFPVFFSLGLFPQINTFSMYFLEQVDMHLFGGNAACSLLASILCVVKSIIAICILYGPAFGGLTEEKGTQHFLFSFFCALLIPIAYHLSRSASDFSHIWVIIKSSLANTLPDENDDENNMPKKSIKVATVDEVDEKSTQAQAGGSSMKVTTSPSSEDIENRSRQDCKHKTYGPGGPLEDTGDISQQSKTICSNESKLDISEDKTEMNCGDVSAEENELSTATLASNTNENEANPELPDPLPKKLQGTVNSRLKNDLVVSTVLALLVLGLHCSTVFTVLQPDLNIVLYIIAGILGFALHYVLPQMRKDMPWLCFARPIFRQREFGQFEVSNAAKVMWFEAAYVCLCFLERNVLYPLIFISAMTADSQNIVKKYGASFGAAIVSVCSLKCVRNAYSDPANQYLILIFSVLLFKIDFSFASETFLINYFIISICFRKSCDFLLKLQFIVTYIAPWQITWGSAFHAFAQPFSVPHSAMLFLQAGISAILSTPLNPFLGSAIFLTSYVRPIKFWERDYNTRRIDHSNTRLSSQLERDLGADDNNLNSIFYEHLTRSLQHSLCGDLLLGRWGNVNQGDCFVLASDYLNCLVHIIELGNGLCTFQMRGLEFRGTYCQQREVEAISEGVEDNDACCCCNPGHIPSMLSINAMFSTRWLAWQVVAAQYVLEGYSISENLATATLQVFEFRKVLITYYIKSIIYYVTKNSKLDKWLASGPIQDSLSSTLGRQFVDLDPIFNYNLDEDFDFRALGITRSSFCSIYLSWIQFCYKKRKDSSTTTISTGNPCNGGDGDNNNSNNGLKIDEKIKKQESVIVQPKNENLITDKNCDIHKNTSKDNNLNNNNNTDHLAGTTESTSSINFALLSETNSICKKNDKDDNNVTSKNNDTNQENQPSLPTTSGIRPRKKVHKRRLKFGVNSPSDPLGMPNQNNNNKNNNTASNNNDSNAPGSSITKDSPLVSLCLALGLLARRSLATASHSSLSGVEFFLHGLHALFKGDFRITSPRDEWVFADMELLHGVVAPAVKMALKLHQDHFSSPDEYLDPSILYEAISSHSKDLVISHEADPIWRSAVLRGAPNLLALRHVMEDGSDEYRIIRLTKRFLNFRVIKLNRECVRGLWAGQQQELIYLRNRNPERGSIQNAKQALRNIINSSCDQPIGYPIYVSPLTTSYADTNEQLCRIIGGAITFESIKTLILDSWRRIRERCREGCSSGSGGLDCDGIGGVNDAPIVYFSPIATANTTGTLSYGSQSLSGTGTRGSLASMNKPNSSTLLAGFLNRERDQERELTRENKNNNSNSRKNIQGQSTTTTATASSTVLSVKEKDRRATLPITSSTNDGSRDFMLRDSADSSYSGGLQKNDYSDTNMSTNKISYSSGNLGDLNQKSNSSMGLESYKTTEFSSALSNAIDDLQTSRMEALNEDDGVGINESSGLVDNNMRTKTYNKEDVTQPLIELNRKVIIVDGIEIYDCLDLGRRIDVIWPNEKMRLSGGRSSWQDWSPQEGMVGYIRHYWQPNHPDPRFRSNVNRTLYLIQINDHYVPVGESGIREYNQIPTDQLSNSNNNHNYNILANMKCASLLNSNNDNNSGVSISSSLALALKNLPHWENQPSSSSSSSATTTAAMAVLTPTDIPLTDSNCSNIDSTCFYLNHQNICSDISNSKENFQDSIVLQKNQIEEKLTSRVEDLSTEDVFEIEIEEDERTVNESK